MDLTLIIPCHNLEAYIQPLLASLKRQIFKDEVEIIFICNQCNDNTERIIFNTSLPQYTTQIVVTNYDTVGPARNAGLDRARGTYIWFIDGDDWLIGDDAIKNVLAAARKANYKIIRFDYEAPNFKARGHKSMVWQYCFRRDFIGDTRFGNQPKNEDVKFMGGLLCDLEIPVPYFDKKLYYYNYLRPGSLMYERIRLNSFGEFNGKNKPRVDSTRA